MQASNTHRARSNRGIVLVLVLAFAGLMILLAATMSASSRSQLDSRRDSTEALHAEMASEAGLEYAQRMLALDVHWAGTQGAAVTIADHGSFEVDLKGVVPAVGGSSDVSLSVTGHHGNAVHRFSTVVRVTPENPEPPPYAMLVLGEDFTMSHGMVYGDVLFADRAHRVNEWRFDAGGEGYYTEGTGPAADGHKQFVCTGVDGKLYKYRDDLPDYQWLGKEVLIEKNTWMPSWNLDDLAIPGPGKTILKNPHNTGNTTWKINGLTYEDTVVIQLTNKQTVTMTNCHFNGGLVVMCPKDYDYGAGGRNLVHLKKGTTIGGGAAGAAANIGLIAPGGTLKSDLDPVSIKGFSLVNDVDLFRNSSINGQLVILNSTKDIADCTITHDPAVTSHLPAWFTYGPPYATTTVLSVYEDFN